ncbi:hypothetical protein Pyn_27426 [Prunus yedoensis var. nudiflora]|uniref:Uncharacterized protein n=1 Tax=Prunus yedoensis var. nudiflora TaxID=2094558 RepID=A0A314XIX1_PRUYE|nr:hypothetical protein Pyn_27426 [Prunus yedoensis var. nudiflora]
MVLGFAAGWGDEKRWFFGWLGLLGAGSVQGLRVGVMRENKSWGEGGVLGVGFYHRMSIGSVVAWF